MRKTRITSVVNTKKGKLAMVSVKTRKEAINQVREEYDVKHSQITGATPQYNGSTHSTYYIVTWNVV